MTDDQLELRLRDWYRAEVPASETAPTALRARVTSIPNRGALRAGGLVPRGITLRGSRRVSTTSLYRGLAAAAVIAVVAVGAGFYLTTPNRPGVVPPSLGPSASPVASASPTPTATPTPSASQSPDTAAVASPSPSPQPSRPSSSPEPCLTDRLTMAAGDAIPPEEGYGLDGLGESRGVFVNGRSSRVIWAVNPGQDTATPVASVSETPGAFDVLDISPDGSQVLIRVGNISPSGGTPECADLWTVRTDGSRATRLTRFTTGRFVTGAAFSPDGRRVAYTWWAPDTVTTLDLETGATIDQTCSTVYSAWPTRVAWSPDGDRYAVACGSNLTIFTANGTTAPARFLLVDEALAFSWVDDDRVLVASSGGNLYSFDTSGTSTVLGTFDDPAIEIVIGTGAFSPDRRWLAYRGGERGDVPGNDFTEVTYVVPAAGGTPTRVPADIPDALQWSADGRSLVYITGRDDDMVLMRLDVETLQSTPVGTITNPAFLRAYRQGIWRVP